MSEEQNKKTAAEELEIFGEHKSREQVRAEERARKQAEREALKAEIKARRQQKKSGTDTTRRKDILVVSIILVSIVVLCVAALALQFIQEQRQERFLQDDTRESYFYDGDATPDMSDEGITAAITQAYYTKGGYLCVQMVLGNGTASEMSLDAIEVLLTNEAEEQIASGYTADVSDDYTIEAGGTNDYTFYISPEHITIKDDPLTTIGYTIHATASPVTDSE